MVGAPAAHRRAHRQLDPALGGELEGVGEQVLQHLLQALAVGDDAAFQIGRHLDFEVEAAALRLVPERPADGFEQGGEDDLVGVHRHGAGLDLGEVEDVGDQVQKVGAGAVDGAGELHLPAREVAVRIVLQLLAEDEDRVQRRAQLVAHIGQEFGLVLGGERELGRLVLQGPAGLLDFLVLGLHLDVTLGQLLSFLLQLFIGLLQLSLLRLKFGGQLLGLGQQSLRLHRRFDGVKDDADAGGELVEE